MRKHTGAVKFVHLFLLVFGLAFIGFGVGMFFLLRGQVTAETEVMGWVLPGIFALVGLVIAVVAVALMARKTARAKRNRRLQEEGLLLYAEYLDCSTGAVMYLNGRPVYNYILRCTFKDAYGRTHIFTQKDVDDDPEPFLRDNLLKVYCDPNDYSRYYVDVRGSYDGEVIEY